MKRQPGTLPASCLRCCLCWQEVHAGVFILLSVQDECGHVVFAFTPQGAVCLTVPAQRLEVGNGFQTLNAWRDAQVLLQLHHQGAMQPKCSCSFTTRGPCSPSAHAASPPGGHAAQVLMQLHHQGAMHIPASPASQAHHTHYKPMRCVCAQFCGPGLWSSAHLAATLVPSIVTNSEVTLKSFATMLPLWTALLLAY